MSQSSFDSHFDESTADVNPFAISLHAQTAPRERFRRAVMFFLLVGGLTAAVLAITWQGKRWLIGSLVSNLETQSPIEQQQRLMQLASFGSDATPTFARFLFSDEDAVSETAFVLLRNQQGDWMTLPPIPRYENHHRLIGSIESAMELASRPADSRSIARASELVRQTWLEVAGPADALASEPVAALASLAQSTLQKLQSLPAKPLDAPVVVARATTSVPTPTEAAGWTDWPPPSARPIQDSPAEATSPSDARVLRSGPTTLRSEPLLSLPPGLTVPLAALSPSPPKPAPVVTTRRAAATVLPVAATLADSPLVAMTDESVLHHLGNPDQVVARQAELELRSRGFSDEQIRFAIRLASAEPGDRVALIDDWLRSTTSDPTPWLAMWLDDPHRSVRLHIVSHLGTIDQLQTRAMLQSRLHRENDLHVATKIRRILDLW